MGNECEWKDGCMDGMPKDILKTNLYEFKNKTTGYRFKVNNDLSKVSVIEMILGNRDDCICLQYRKPEVIIKKSGGTWTAYCEGDRICLNPGIYKDSSKRTRELILKYPESWPLISEIEITDEIAKLNPMVSVRDFRNNYNLNELIGVKDHTVITWDGESSVDSAMHDVEIATIEIIENLED